MADGNVSLVPEVITVCGDAGGAKAVAPVIERLRADGRVDVRALAYVQACQMWAERNLEFEELRLPMPSSNVAQILSTREAALLLTGTSVNPFGLEKQFIGEARRIGLASLTVLDFWSNYALRFSDDTGRLAFVPDLIAVMDDRALNEMVTEGFSPSRLVITGQPAFDELASYRSRMSPARRSTVRHSLGVGSEELLVVFASQPLSELYGTDPANPKYPGYDETAVLELLVDALDRVAEKYGQAIVLAIRLHPRERTDRFQTVYSRRIRLLVPTNGASSCDVATAADLVTGMTSAFLVEASYLGCTTISLQPGLRLPDVLQLDRRGLGSTVYREEEIEPALERMLLDEDARPTAQVRLASIKLEDGATRRVAELAYRMMT